MNRIERNIADCQKPLEVDADTQKAFADRQAKLVKDRKFPVAHWYNDANFCRAYNTLVALQEKYRRLVKIAHVFEVSACQVRDCEETNTCPYYEHANIAECGLLNARKVLADIDTKDTCGGAERRRRRTMSRYEELDRFVDRMEKMLLRNEHKVGWEDCSLAFLMGKLAEEYDEIVRVVLSHAIQEPVGVVSAIEEKSRQDFANKCADLANICMMLVDNFGPKEPAPGRRNADDGIMG